MKFSTAPIILIFSLMVVTSSLFADMPLPFPEELGLTETEINASVTPEKNVSGVTKSNETKEVSEFVSKGTESENVSTENSSKSLQMEESKTTNVSFSDPTSVQKTSDRPEEEVVKSPEKTILPNSEKTSLKKKKDKKKEDPSESGYKKGLLRLRENQRNKAKSEFDQSSVQGKSANSSRLENARLTAENSNDANAITEQIDSEDEKWKAVFEVARALRGSGKIPEAETQYLKIITEAPENFQSISLLSLGEMLSSTDRKDSARRYLLQLVKLLQKKPELDPKRDQLEKAVTLIARIYGDQGRYEEAENWAKTYLNRLNPEASEDSPFVKELRRILKRRYY
ncbi:tetratricopeptide repeat protein [Leptospira weilii]|uniref:tetratricopeptide repeat protein n=1 Tax=Leptospira weilii TaxID=28184 RepID=UPI00030870B8|nr:tetratricopeptide repeat protein [Leptospira weilii]MDL5245157.1 tetratricopeptide repeat protein [Leptospira weilii]